MPVKKSAAVKKRGPGRPKGSRNKPKDETATPAKRGPGRPKGSKNKTSKRGPGRPPKNVKEVKKPKSKRGGANREINPDTGFAVATDSDVIAQYLLEGGESRAAIVDALYDVLDNETRTGTEKPITNMVSGVLKKMMDRGYTTESSFRVVPPTAASKRAATRAANSTKKTAAPAKTTAKKTAKRGPGRPKGSKNRK